MPCYWLGCYCSCVFWATPKGRPPRVIHYGAAGVWQEFKRARGARFAGIQSGDHRGDSLAGAGL
jgi:hypothetical protein